ncbi:MAG: DUF4382 domain-containing protein [Ignavibacteriaceae bacterium]
MKKLVVLFSLLIFGAVIYYGCAKKDNPIGPTSTSGMLKVQMIDSPADYSEVNIVIDSVQAHISTSDSTTGWVTLNNQPATYDLLKLVNGANAVIGEDTLQAGYYTQIRLFIGSGSNIVSNGQTFSLTTPSGSQSGIKLNVDATVQPGIAYLLTLDFDANRSIVKTGSLFNAKYILKPVIRAVAMGTTGIIAGTVSPISESSNVWAITGTDTVSTSTDAAGGFKLQYLSPSTYSVYIAPNDTSYKDTTIANVNVTPSNTNNIGTVILTKK